MGVAEFLRYHKVMGNNISAGDLVIVSLGTGKAKPTKLEPPQYFNADGSLPWVLSGNGLIQKMMQASESADAVQSLDFFENYIRFNPGIHKELLDMDKSDSKHLNKLKSFAEGYVEEYKVKPVLKKMAKCLANYWAEYEDCHKVVVEGRFLASEQELVFHFDESNVLPLSGQDIEKN